MEQKILQSKKKLENRILIRLVKFLDVLFVTAIFGCIWMKFYSKLITSLDKGTQPFVVCDG